MDMKPDVIHFSYIGCGICCKGRLIPLTLDEQGNTHRPQADLESGFLRDQSRRQTGQRDRRRRVGEDAEIEHEQVRTMIGTPSSSSTGAAMERVMMEWGMVEMPIPSTRQDAAS